MRQYQNVSHLCACGAPGADNSIYCAKIRYDLDTDEPCECVCHQADDEDFKDREAVQRVAPDASPFESERSAK